MKTGRYWLRLLRLFHHYRRKSTRLPYLPIRLWIELTSHCNFRCVMCPNQDLNKEDRGTMAMSLYRKIIDEARAFAFDINLAHRGESLLHPHLIEAIRYAKSQGLYTRLHTNGSLLTEKLSQEIIASGLDRLSFSFDGYTKEAYESIRRGGDFDKTIGNIIQLLQAKQDLQAEKPEVAVEVINFKDMPPDDLSRAKDAFHARFRGLPLDSFNTKELHNWAGEVPQTGRTNAYSLCPFPWNALVIFWDGGVLPCTQDFFGYNRIGDVSTDSLQAVWNSDGMRALRRKLGNRTIDDLKACSQCDRVWRKGLLGVPKEYLWKFISRKMP
jgi:radical SAM protein with 4Fe4S-binding SPASM domain